MTKVNLKNNSFNAAKSGEKAPHGCIGRIHKGLNTEYKLLHSKGQYYGELFAIVERGRGKWEDW